MTEQTTTRKHTAGALDIRNIIGGLLGVYGVILMLMGHLRRQGARQDRRRQRQPVGRPRDARRRGAAFLVWARVRPVVVPEHVEPSRVSGRRRVERDALDPAGPVAVDLDPQRAAGAVGGPDR